MPRKGISYEQVAKACTDLEKSQRLSVRAIQARTGGSMTTVLKHYRRWQRERTGQTGVETTISDRLRHALLSELEETAAQARQTVRQDLLEAQQQLIRLEKEAKAKQARVTQQLQLTQQQKKRLEQKLQKAEQRTAAAEKQLRIAQTRLNATHNSLQREQRNRFATDADLHKVQDLKPTDGNPPPIEEQTPQALTELAENSPEPKKTATRKKPKKKDQQSLFDF